MSTAKAELWSWFLGTPIPICSGWKDSITDDGIAQECRVTARLPFRTSLWIVIVVALVSALAPLGPPSSRTTGSAFNPATTSVVIKAAGPRRTWGETARLDGRYKSTAHVPPMFCLLMLVPLLCALGLVDPRAVSFPLAASGRGSFLSRRHVRAPPLLL
ncbi:hypothetical protein [Sphingobium mellinum]|uniref:hypothetical protein n=1 Tax=Sphingobium mellinum TaxID=1387166 RepID=UPI0030EEED3E